MLENEEQQANATMPQCSSIYYCWRLLHDNNHILLLARRPSQARSLPCPGIQQLKIAQVRRRGIVFGQYGWQDSHHQDYSLAMKMCSS